MNSVKCVFAVSETFPQLVLKLNLTKSTLIYIGQWKKKPIAPPMIKTTSGSFNMLGTEIRNDDKRFQDKT